MVKVRAGTQKMQKTFLLAANLTISSTEQGVISVLLDLLCAGMLPQEGSESLISSRKPQASIGNLQ